MSLTARCHNVFSARTRFRSEATNISDISTLLDHADAKNVCDLFRQGQRPARSSLRVHPSPQCFPAATLWLIAAALAADTTHLRFIVAFRPGFILPTLAAQQTGTLQRISGGRALINIVVGGDAAEQRSYGDFLEHDARYDRADEFMTIARK